MKSLTVIMPALNEAKNLEYAIDNVLQSFKKFSVDGELIVVNDGSTDNTAEVAGKFVSSPPQTVRILEHSHPQGIGASFWDGVNQAAKDVVVMIPGDGENDASEIIKYLGLIDNVDIVNPYVVNKQVRGFLRNFVSNLFLDIINFTFRLRLNYTNGTVMYNKRIFTGLTFREKGFFYQVEALIKAIKQGYLYAQVPYRLSIRSKGSSKAISLKALRGVAAGYLRLVRDVYFTGKRFK